MDVRDPSDTQLEYLCETETVRDMMENADDVEGLKQLIAQDPEMITQFTTTSLRLPLHLACVYGRAGCVKMLLEHSPELQIFTLDDNDYIPLQIACELGYRDCVSLLLEHQPERQLCTQTGPYTCLTSACLSGHVDCVRLLLQYCPEQLVLLKCDEEEEYFPLHFASLELATVLLQWLPERQVMQKSPHGELPLHTAVYDNKVELASLLLRWLPELQVMQEDTEGCLPIHRAGSVECIQLLLEHEPENQIRHGGEMRIKLEDPNLFELFVDLFVNATLHESLLDCVAQNEEDRNRVLQEVVRRRQTKSARSMLGKRSAPLDPEQEGKKLRMIDDLPCAPFDADKL